MWYNDGMKRKWRFSIPRYGLGLLIALLIFWGFYGFIKDDNWLAVSALATLVLALAAFWAIRQNYLLHKRERRERQLNKIIEWATQTVECGRDPAFTGQRLNLTGKRLTTFEFDLNIAIQSAFNVLSWKAVHIGFLAQHSIGNEGLKDAVEDTRTLIRQQSKLLSLASARKLKDNAAIGRHRKKVDDNAKKVIELAVKLL